MNNTTNPDAVSLLAEQFPNVPTRILVATLASYLERTGNQAEAVEAAAHRIADAIAA